MVLRLGHTGSQGPPTLLSQISYGSMSRAYHLSSSLLHREGFFKQNIQTAGGTLSKRSTRSESRGNIGPSEVHRGAQENRDAMSKTVT